jgi:hypothetical protein
MCPATTTCNHIQHYVPKFHVGDGHARIAHLSWLVLSRACWRSGDSTAAAAGQWATGAAAAAWSACSIASGSPTRIHDALRVTCGELGAPSSLEVFWAGMGTAPMAGRTLAAQATGSEAGTRQGWRCVRRSESHGAGKHSISRRSCGLVTALVLALQLRDRGNEIY